MKWAGLGPRRLALGGIIGLVIVAGVIGGLTIPNLRPRIGASASQVAGVNAPVQGAGAGAGAQATGNSVQSQVATGEQAVNWQTLLICGGAVVVGIGGLALAAYLDQRQRRRRSTRPASIARPIRMSGKPSFSE